MGNGWTPERRARQRAMIQQWRPWEKSTGPRTDEGKAASAQNALWHGGRSMAERERVKQFNALMREQLEMLKRVS